MLIQRMCPIITGKFNCCQIVLGIVHKIVPEIVFEIVTKTVRETDHKIVHEIVLEIIALKMESSPKVQGPFSSCPSLILEIC